MARTTRTCLALTALLVLLLAISASPARADCVSPPGITMQIGYNLDFKVFQYCDDTVWKRMNQNPGTGSGGCANPTLPEGQFGYNIDHRVMQGCAGSVHRPFGPSGGKFGWKQISAGSTHTCGIKSDGSLWCWGLNGSGRTGLNTASGDTQVPTAISGAGTWKQVSAGALHSCGIKSDDTLWCWGANSDGATGLNTTVGNTLVPTQISGGGSWKQVTAGGGASHTCGIKSDDSLHCWGSNLGGQLGDNSTTQRLIPTAISGGGSWKQVSVGAQYTCAIKLDNTLHCWGFNGSGQLGDNSTTQRLIPTAISGGGSWKQIAAGNGHSCAVKSDDRLR